MKFDLEERTDMKTDPKKAAVDIVVSRVSVSNRAKVK